LGFYRRDARDPCGREPRVGEDLVVALALPQLAEHVEDAEIRLEVDVPVAEEGVLLGGSLRLARSARL